jgi:hypothetical protein
MYERPGPLLIFQNHDMTRPSRLVLSFMKEPGPARNHIVHLENGKGGQLRKSLLANSPCAITWRRIGLLKPGCLQIGVFMPIRKHLTDKAAFGPAAIEAMSKAFEETCIALQVSAGDEKGREIIATRIIDLARSGLIDPAALRDRVLSE